MAPTTTNTTKKAAVPNKNKKRPYDIILFGATGDTGRCVAHFLHNKGALLGISSWTLAARNSTKINTMFEPILSKNSKSKNVNGIQCGTPIIANCNDYESLLAMASQATVILTCAGPFTTYGEIIIKACVECSTHYVDITGETPWVNSMASTYGEDAKAKGLYMISQAGYDSVPSDLTVALAAEMMVKDDCNYVETHHELKGGSMPTGTVNTMLHMVLMLRRAFLAVVTLGLVGGTTAEEKRDQSRREEEKGKRTSPGLVPKHVKGSIARDMKWNNLLPYSSLAKSWSFPHFMAVANAPIVHTTADSLGYGVSAGKGFIYRERLTFSSFIGGNMKGSFLAWAKFMIFFLVGGVLMLPLIIPSILLFPNTTSRLIKWFNNYDFGNNKRDTFRNLFNGYQPFGFTKCVALASNGSGKVMATASFEGDYDAGLGFTALSATTVAAAILKRIANGKEGKGFDTAVVAIGPGALREVYELVGIRFDCKLNGKL